MRDFRMHVTLETGDIYNKKARHIRCTQAKCKHEALVNSVTNCNQASFMVTLTRQLVVVQPEVCECSQLAELGWDAT